MSVLILPDKKPSLNEVKPPEVISLSSRVKSEIEQWLKKYPPNQRQSAILPALLSAQRHHQGWLPRPLIDAVADYIKMPRIAAYEVATFYSLLELKPVGRHKISVCTNISCMLNGCDKIANHLKNRLKINFGETTKDKRFTLKEVECLGACINPPVIMVNEMYYENITIEKMDTVLEKAD